MISEPPVAARGEHVTTRQQERRVVLGTQGSSAPRVRWNVARQYRLNDVIIGAQGEQGPHATLKGITACKTSRFSYVACVSAETKRRRYKLPSMPFAFSRLSMISG